MLSLAFIGAETRIPVRRGLDDVGDTLVFLLPQSAGHGASTHGLWVSNEVLGLRLPYPSVAVSLSCVVVHLAGDYKEFFCKPDIVVLR